MSNNTESIKKDIKVSAGGYIIENNIITDRSYLEVEIPWTYIDVNPGRELQTTGLPDWIKFKCTTKVESSYQNPEDIYGETHLEQRGYTTYIITFSEYLGTENRNCTLTFIAGNHSFTEDQSGQPSIKYDTTTYIYNIEQVNISADFSTGNSDIWYKYDVTSGIDGNFENINTIFPIKDTAIVNTNLTGAQDSVLVTIKCNNPGRLKFIDYNLTSTNISIRKKEDLTNLIISYILEVPNNTMGTLYIKDPNRLIQELLIVNISRGTIKPSQDIQKDYWKNGVEYTLIDRNEGSDMDATALLFKQTQSNAYSTIEQKDNTLFLGNYTTLNPFQSIFQILDSQKNYIQSAEQEKIIPLKINSSSYSYVPDLSQNSRDKRLFKKGENYLLGFVLVYNNGYRSPVYYFDIKWSPSIEPYMVTSSIDDVTTYGYIKPIYQVTLPTTITDALAQNNIIGIIPVYAINTSYNILCQGFISPTVQNKLRKNNNEIVAQYSWYYRQIPQAKDVTFLPYRVGGDGENKNNKNLEFQYLDIHTEGNTSKENGKITPSVPIQGELSKGSGEPALAEINWQYNTQYMTINTPEVEFDEYLTEYMLKGCSIRDTYVYGGFNFINGASIEFRNGYPYSKFNASVYNSIRDRRAISEYAWYGFLNKRDREPEQGWRPDNPDWVKNTEENNTEKDVAYNIAILREKHYRDFMVYPWQRDIPGGEKADTMITSKVILNYLYNSGIPNETMYDKFKVFVDPDPNDITNNPPQIEQINLYRDFDTVSLVRFPNALETGDNQKKDGYYQGNIDYAATTPKLTYTAYADTSGKNTDLFPRYGYGLSADNDVGQYAGYNQFGEIKSPISLKYKAAPHLIVKFNKKVLRGDIAGTVPNSMDSTLHCVELYNEIDYHTTNPAGLSNYQWVQCGNLKRVEAGEPTTLVFEEGDYYFARYDSMRTRPYTEKDPNSIVEVVSGMLCSRVNLDARTDRNRGTSNPFINDRNFNRFNPVYNQSNNYFNYSYVGYNNFIMNRKFSNTIQWSLTKIYGNEIDDWCRIQQSSSLDLDGDKGTLTALKRLKNSLFAFQDTGISQIMYNEQTQISTLQGVPIEIGNSNKVSGKHYVQHKIGCQQQKTIATTEDAIFFIDSINKSIYAMAENGTCIDIGHERGMYSWEKNNIHDNWWTYYDYYLKEVLFTSPEICIGYNTKLNYFTSFLSYENTRWNFKAGSRTISILNKDKYYYLPEDVAILMHSTNDLQQQGKYMYSHRDKVLAYESAKSDYDKKIDDAVKQSTTCWLKNNARNSKFFGRYRKQSIELICTNTGMDDITFTNIYYKMDCYSKEGNYLHDKTFTQLAVQNEYQHTGVTPLSLYGTHEHNNPRRDKQGNIIRDDNGNIVYEKVKTTNCPSNLKKKFREWRIQVPRSLYGKFQRHNISGDVLASIPALPNVELNETNLEGGTLVQSRDRIRNHWCKVELTLDNPEVEQLIFHDITIQYYI